jgi:transposase
MRKPRKNYSPSEKVALLKKHLLDKKPVSEVCDAVQLSPTIFYQWQKQFFESGHTAFEKASASTAKRHQDQITQLEQSVQKKNEIVAELLEENLRLKKAHGER